MNLRQFPFFEKIVERGTDNYVFNVLLLFGPVLIFLIVIFGRSIFTVVLALLYIIVFVVYVLFRSFKME